MYSTEVPLLFNSIPEHIDSLILSWHNIKNSSMIETWLLHLQPFMIRHFPTAVEMLISYVLLQWPKREGGWSGTSQLNQFNNCSADVCCVGLGFCAGIWHVVTSFVCAAEAILGMSLIPHWGRGDSCLWMVGMQEVDFSCSRIFKTISVIYAVCKPGAMKVQNDRHVKLCSN
jgi:hypothetical protein